MSVEPFVEVLYGQRVVFKNKETFLKKMELLKKDGASKFNVVSDFDFTLTKFWLHGKRGASCYKVIEDCGLLSDHYHKTAQAIQIKYYALEVDPNLDKETKTNYMIEWVTVANKLLCESSLTDDIIRQAVTQSVQNGNVALRGIVATFINTLGSLGIPLLIFSAGICDVLEKILHQYEIRSNDKLHIITNRCIFGGPNGELSAFEDPVLHVFNKKASGFLHTPYFQQSDLPNRTNLLLLGDSTGDVLMSEGMTFNPETYLKVGFLNDKPERLPQYLEVYDLVILDDPDFSVPLGIISDICAGAQAVDGTAEVLSTPVDQEA